VKEGGAHRWWEETLHCGKSQGVSKAGQRAESGGTKRTEGPLHQVLYYESFLITTWQSVHLLY
jgi:hypothetical protein